MAALALTITSLIWLWRAADPGSVWPLLKQAHPPTLVIALILLVSSLVTKALRWRALLPTPGNADLNTSTLSRTEAVRIFHISILLNNVLPFRVGDGARVLSPSVRRAATMQQALVTLLAERLLDGLSLVLVGLLVLPPFFRATGRQAVVDGLSAPGTGSLALLGVGVSIGLIALAIFARIRWEALRTLVANQVHSLRVDALSVVRRSPHDLGYVAATTVIAWGATFLMHYAALEAFNPPSALVGPVLLAVVVTLSTNLSMLAPATPGGIGIFHAAAAAPLLVAGVPSEVAVAYALLVHVINTVPPILIGAVCLGGPVLTARFRTTPPT